MTLLYTLLLLVALVIPDVSDAAIRYASSAGAGLTCTNIATPCTLSTAYAQAVAGDEVQIRAGTMAGINENVLALNNGTGSGNTYSNPITIRSYPGETVTLTPVGGTDSVLNLSKTGTRYLIIKDLIIDGQNSVFFPISFAGARIKFDNVECKRGTGSCVIGSGQYMWWTGGSAHDSGTSSFDHGFYLGGHDMIVEGAEIYNTPGAGIHNYDGTNLPSRNTYRNNRVHHNLWGLLIWTGTLNKAYNNIVRNNTIGFDLGGGDSAGGVYNNTIVSNTTGINLTSPTIPVNTIIRNNILSENGSAFAGAGTTSTFSHNFCFKTATTLALSDCRPSGSDTNTIINQPPRFADAANNDFRLCTDVSAPHASCIGASSALGSINPGADLSATFTTDFAGTTREVPWDRGAFESGDNPPTPPTPAVVMQISCDNTVIDSSGSANHGTLTNGATHSASGKYNQACSFDGTDDYVAVADSASLDLTHGFTLAAWVFPTSAMTTFKSIMVKDYVFYLYGSSEGYCGAGGILAGYDTGTTAVNACYGTALTANTWTHLAATYNRTSLIIYVNGVPVTSAAGSAFLPVGIGAVRIGSSNAAFGEYFAGLIDEPYIKNTALSAAEVVTLMNTPVNAAVPNTVTVRMASTGMKFAGTTLKFGSTTPAVPSYILLETADHLLKEDGDDVLSEQ